MKNLKEQIQPDPRFSSIEFIDLKAQQKRIKPQVDQAIQNVLDHGRYVMGPEIAELEQQLCEFTGSSYCLACSSGTTALSLILMADNIGPGDVVFIPSFTFVATAEVVVTIGATPVFVDVLPDTYNMDPASLERQIQYVQKNTTLNAKAIMTVDLFGQTCDYDAIEIIAEKYGLTVYDDAAQACGSTYKGRKVGTIGRATATSFFPAKPLGCYGDGGAVFTDDTDMYDRLVRLRDHGRGHKVYEYEMVGINGRMNTMQAAILIEKLKIFPDELIKRQFIAQRYNDALSPFIKTPYILDQTTTNWAIYTICLSDDIDRAELQKSMKEDHIPTAIYYPVPLHLQEAYVRKTIKTDDELPVTCDLANRVISLPIHPYLDEDVQDYIIERFKVNSIQS